MSSTPPTTSRGPRGGRPSSRRWLALGLIAAAQFMVIMDTSIIGVALPQMQADLGFSPEGLSWVFNAYVVAFGGLLLLGGRLSDLYGARRIFSTGWAVLAVGSLVAALADGVAVELVGRAVQGAGSALIAPSALALLFTIFGATPKELTKATDGRRPSGLLGTLPFAAGNVLVTAVFAAAAFAQPAIGRAYQAGMVDVVDVDRDVYGAPLLATAAAGVLLLGAGSVLLGRAVARRPGLRSAGRVYAVAIPVFVVAGFTVQVLQPVAGLVATGAAALVALRLPRAVPAVGEGRALDDAPVRSAPGLRPRGH